jgi:hypothetical protein
MIQNLCHKLANESLFIGFAVTLLTIIATVAYNVVWPSIVVLFTLKAAHDFSKCNYTLVAKSRNSREQRVLQPLKV